MVHEFRWRWETEINRGSSCRRHCPRCETYEFRRGDKLWLIKLQRNINFDFPPHSSATLKLFIADTLACISASVWTLMITTCVISKQFTISWKFWTNTSTTFANWIWCSTSIKSTQSSTKCSWRAKFEKHPRQKSSSNCWRSTLSIKCVFPLCYKFHE